MRVLKELSDETTGWRRVSMGWMRWLGIWLLVGVGSVRAAEGVGGNTEASGGLVVRDVAVFLLDAFGNQLNDKDLFQSTLPPSALPDRPLDKEKGDRPSPVGLITFEGGAPVEIDVLLDPSAGQALAAWPRASLKRKRILWEDLQLTREAPVTETLLEREWLLPLRQSDRLYATLNKGTDRFLLYDVELAYRPVIKVARTKVKAGETEPKDEFTLENGGGYTVHDVIMLQPVRGGDGWRATYLESLPGVPTKKRKPTQRPGVRERPDRVEEVTDPESVFVRPLTNKDLPPEPEVVPEEEKKEVPDRKLETEEAEWSAYLAEAAFDTLIDKERATRRIPAVIEGRRNGTTVTYRAKFVDQPEGSEVRVHYNLAEAEYQALEKEYEAIGLNRVSLQSYGGDGGKLRYQAIWLAYADEKLVETRFVSFSDTMAVPGLPPRLRKSLVGQGLDLDSVAHVERVLAEVAFGEQHATVIYRLDPEEMENLLPLELTPEPDRLVRVGLVVMLNGDPDFPKYVQGIIEGLADSRWKEREAAMARLRDLGVAARPDLKSALKHKDVEVAWRAEILLEELKNP